MQNTYLCHYGVKGMKWGVRKASTSGSGSLQARTISTLTKMQASAKKRPHGAIHRITANPNRKRLAWIKPVGDYGITSGPEPTGGANSYISQLTAVSKKYTSDPIGFYAHDIGMAATKLQRAMRTNLYSPEQKIAIGQQLIGRMAGNTMAMAFGTLAGQATVIAGAALVTAAIKAKQRHDSNKPTAQLESAKNSFFAYSSRSKNTFTVDDYNRHVDSLASKTSSPEQKKAADKAIAELKRSGNKSPTYFTYGYKQGTSPTAEKIATKLKSEYPNLNWTNNYTTKQNNEVMSRAKQLTKEAFGDYGNKAVRDGQSGWETGRVDKDGKVHSNGYNLDLHNEIATIATALAAYPDLKKGRGI